MYSLIFTFIAIAFAVVASAQTISSTSAEERAKASAEELRSALSLSEQQYNKVYKAYLKMWRKENKRMAQQEADRTATDNAVKGVLTAEQAKRFERAGFAEKKMSQKGTYFSSEGVTFAYPASTAEVWEKRAYFYAYTYPEIVGADETLDESIKKQFTGGNHDAFYKQQLKYCDWFRENVLFEE